MWRPIVTASQAICACMPFFQLDDVRLHYRSLGSGETVVLIHGLGSSGDDWAFQEAPLAADFHLIIPDLRGSGRSDPGTSAWSIGRFAEDLWALLDHLGEFKVRLLGYSLGGAVALEMALQRPASVQRLMTINSLPSYRIDTWRKWLEVHGQLTLVRVLGLRRTAGLVARRLFPLPHQRAMRERVVLVVSGLSKSAYLKTAAALSGWCALERRANLSMPFLMLAAEFDYTPLAEKRAFATVFGAQFAVVRGSRHGTPFDSITACNACAIAFLHGRALPDEAQLRIDSADIAPKAPPPGFGNASESPIPHKAGADG